LNDAEGAGGRLVALLSASLAAETAMAPADDFASAPASRLLHPTLMIGQQQ
jgi:hypothetical protein